MAGEPRCAGTLGCPGGSHLPGDDVARLVTRCDVFGNGAPSRGAVRYARPGSPTMPSPPDPLAITRLRYPRGRHQRAPVRHHAGRRAGAGRQPAELVLPSRAPAAWPAQPRAARPAGRRASLPASRAPSAPARRHHDRDRLTAFRGGSNGHDHRRTLTEQQRPELATGLAKLVSRVAGSPSPDRISRWLGGRPPLGSARWGRAGSGHCGQAAIPDLLLRQSVSGYRWPASAIMRTPITDNRTSRARSRRLSRSWAMPGPAAPAERGPTARSHRRCGSSGRRGGSLTCHGALTGQPAPLGLPQQR